MSRGLALVIDDDADMRELLAAVLEMIDFESAPAGGLESII